MFLCSDDIVAGLNQLAMDCLSNILHFCSLVGLSVLLLNGSKFYSLCDLCQGYWQTTITEEDWDKTAFIMQYFFLHTAEIGSTLCMLITSHVLRLKD